MRNYITPIIIDKIPDFIKLNFKEFNLFLNHFYEFLEQYGNPLEVLETFYEKTESNNQEDDFIDKILYELGFDIQNLELKISKKELILHLRNFYLNKGNENSFKFLFKLLYNSNINISYPRKQLFKLSDSTYSGRYFIFTTTNNLGTLEFEHILKNSENYSISLYGLSSGISSYVESIQLLFYGTLPILKIQIDSFQKDYIIEEPIVIIENISNKKIIENVYNIVDFEIENSGNFYQQNDKIIVNNSEIEGLSVVHHVERGSIDNLQIISGGNNYAINDLIHTSNIEKGHSFSAIVSSISDINNFLSIPSQSSLQLETGNFTLECWVFPIYNKRKQTICSNYNSNGQGWLLNINGDETISFSLFRGIDNPQESKSVFKVFPNRWNHIAVTRQANTIRLFINGRLSRETIILNAFTSNNPLKIGNDHLGNSFIGYMNELRITKNVCRYTESFDVKKQKFDSTDPHWSNVSLLIHFEGFLLQTNFVDSSSSPKSITTSGSIYIELKESIFGTSSGFFSGKGSINGITILNNGYNYERLPTIQIKSELGQHAIIVAQSNNIGKISGIKIIKPYINSDEFTVSVSVLSETGNGAIIKPIHKTVFKEDFDFKTYDGFLSLNCNLLDSYYHQQFSYKTETNVSRNISDKIVDDFLHPAGFVRFNLLKIQSIEKINFQLDQQEFLIGYEMTGFYFVGYYENYVFVILGVYETEEEAVLQLTNIITNYPFIQEPLISDTVFKVEAIVYSEEEALEYVSFHTDKNLVIIPIKIFIDGEEEFSFNIIEKYISLSNQILFNPIKLVHWLKEISQYRYTNWISGFDWIKEEETYEDTIYINQAMDAYRILYHKYLSEEFLFNSFFNLDWFKNSELFDYSNDYWDHLQLEEINSNKYFNKALDAHVSIVIP